MPSETSRVNVSLGDRSYDIVFDELDSLGRHITNAFNGEPGRCVVVSNTVVGPIYGKTATKSLEVFKWKAQYLEIQDGEENKTVDTYADLLTRIIGLGIDRKTVIVAIGGGVTTDIVGFVAATALRGLPFVNVPTSLLAMVDASVGGKTGINSPHGKNLIGAFWQPRLVLASMDCLKTLSDKEYRCGLGEVIKHAVLDDKTRYKTKIFDDSFDFMQWIETNGAALAARDKECLEVAVKRSCEVKSAVVAEDELESGARALLNLGHTVAHAIEFCQGMGKGDALPHGEAVGVGTLAETQLAVKRGVCKDKGLPDRLAKLLRLCGLPTGVKGLNIEDLIEASRKDKKAESEFVKVTQPVEVGNVILEKILPQDLRYAFEQLEPNLSLAT